MFHRRSKWLTNPFIVHPHENEMTFFGHFKFAFSTGCYMMYAGACCIFHAFFPFFFTDTASTAIRKIYDNLPKRLTTDSNIDLLSTNGDRDTPRPFVDNFKKD